MSKLCESGPWNSDPSLNVVGRGEGGGEGVVSTIKLEAISRILSKRILGQCLPLV